mmetsp:Transcript_22477/g.32194  ORF Transcript_22477/g.32194 Transcript_22477/m.32194 type:complete len:129 (-) Transcript_22477:2090-2476(-)
MKPRDYQPFYFYLDEDAIRSFAIRVSLRKVADSPIVAAGISSCSLMRNSCISGSEPTTMQTVGWQEKLMCPRECISRHREENLDELSEAERTYNFQTAVELPSLRPMPYDNVIMLLSIYPAPRRIKYK